MRQDNRFFSKLFIIDELGYLNINEHGADLMFQLMSTRYEQRSTIITSNVETGGWTKVFGDDVSTSILSFSSLEHMASPLPLGLKKPDPRQL